MTRRQLRQNFGDEPSTWKAYPPQWCKRKVWEGLCDVWAKPGWHGLSLTNRANKAKDGGVAHHVAGQCSMHRVRKKLMIEKPEGVCSKEVFDKMHMKKMPDGYVYVNGKAADVAACYDFLKSQPEAEGITNETIWREASSVETRRGMFGFGYRSITRDCPLPPMQSMTGSSTATKSTATSTTKSTAAGSSVELEKLLAERDKQYAEKLAEQERRHKQ